jgi:hypothetical protein
VRSVQVEPQANAEPPAVGHQIPAEKVAQVAAEADAIADRGLDAPPKLKTNSVEEVLTEFSNGSVTFTSALP